MKFWILSVFCSLRLFSMNEFAEIKAFCWDYAKQELAWTNAALRLSPSIANTHFYLMKGGSQGSQDFYSLTLTQEDGQNIHYIIKSMAKSGWLALLKKKSELERCGDSIRHVHPLRFLGFIFSDPQRKHYIHMVKKSTIKWSQFKGGLFPNLKKEYDRGQLFPFLSSFAKAVGVDKQLLAHYIQREDWDGFLNALL